MGKPLVVSRGAPSVASPVIYALFNHQIQSRRDQAGFSSFSTHSPMQRWNYSLSILDHEVVPFGNEKIMLFMYECKRITFLVCSNSD